MGCGILASVHGTLFMGQNVLAPYIIYYDLVIIPVDKIAKKPV